MCRTAAPAAALPEGGARGVELADIFRAHGGRYRQTHALAPIQRQAMTAIATCRTAALGGRLETCDRCGAVRVVYNSCRNRHCPKCQTLEKQRWLEAQRAALLPIDYFHVVFTLPHELNPLAQGNPRLIYDLLFQSAADTLQTFARDPRHLGGTLGITAILHTWGQTLAQHLHLHCVVTGGALAPDGARWIPGRQGFLFPVRALSQMFRGKYLQALRAASARGQLRLAGRTLPLADPAGFARFLRALRRHPWVVYAKAPCAGAEQVLDYLSRYTHRAALSNDRLVAFRDHTVWFRWRDRAHGNRVHVMALDAEEFIRRFLLHVLPKGFTRIRHFGLLANRARQSRLQRCRELLGQAPPPAPEAPESAADMMCRLTGLDLQRCPVCRKGRLWVTTILAPASAPPPRSQACDSS